jgi:hypothetical protein
MGLQSSVAAESVEPSLDFRVSGGDAFDFDQMQSARFPGFDRMR